MIDQMWQLIAPAIACQYIPTYVKVSESYLFCLWLLLQRCISVFRWEELKQYLLVGVSSHILWTPSVMVHQLYSTKGDGPRKIKIYFATARKYYDVSWCLKLHCAIMTRGWRPMEPGVVDDCLQCLSTIMTHHTNSSKQHHHHLCSFVKYVWNNRS